MRVVKRILCVSLLVGIVLVGLGVYAFVGKGPLHSENAPKMLMIKPGQGFSKIADTLEAQGVIHSAVVFKTVGWLTGSYKQCKPGEYQFEPGISAKGVLAKLVVGDIITHSITFPEGKTNAEILASIEQNTLLSGGMPETLPEGSLLPETYHFNRGDRRAALIERLQKDQQRVLAKAWGNRAANIAVDTPEQAIILASIVEKETGLASERRRVAAVFSNRLKIGMPLQADPTVRYAVELADSKKLERPLTTKDLRRDLPHNTYVNKGLPPTPICNPGKAAIEATLNPLDTKELYFVATGGGGHNFAETLAEHNANVAAYRKALQAQQKD